MSDKKVEKGMDSPFFSLPDENGSIVTIDSFKGKWIVLYFYPKDNTPGCTLEGKDFSDKIDDFHSLGAEVVGVSPDSQKKHCNFRTKHNLKVILLSDVEHKTLEDYGVWQLKKMMGREYMGVVRTTFLIDPNGKIEKVWNRVKVKNHVADILKELKTKTSQ